MIGIVYLIGPIMPQSISAIINKRLSASVKAILPIAVAICTTSCVHESRTTAQTKSLLEPRLEVKLVKSHLSSGDPVFAVVTYTNTTPNMITIGELDGGYTALGFQYHGFVNGHALQQSILAKQTKFDSISGIATVRPMNPGTSASIDITISDAIDTSQAGAYSVIIEGSYFVGQDGISRSLMSNTLDWNIAR